MPTKLAAPAPRRLRRVGRSLAAAALLLSLAAGPAAGQTPAPHADLAAQGEQLVAAS